MALACPEKRLPAELWSRYFEQVTRGVPTREYMAQRVLPRPRDILYLTNAAIEAAVQHRHTRVTEADVLDGERQYSQFAFGVLLVEGGGDIADLENILFEFAGAPDVIDMAEVHNALRRAGVTDLNQVSEVTEQLIALSFLGRETHEEQFEFAENPRDRKRLAAVARRFAAGQGSSPRFRVHPAFQAFLDIGADAAQQSLQI